MAAKQPTFGMAHATVIPRNFDPEGGTADDSDGDEPEAAADDETA